MAEAELVQANSLIDLLQITASAFPLRLQDVRYTNVNFGEIYLSFLF